MDQRVKPSFQSQSKRNINTNNNNNNNNNNKNNNNDNNNNDNNNKCNNNHNLSNISTSTNEQPTDSLLKVLANVQKIHDINDNRMKQRKEINLMISQLQQYENQTETDSIEEPSASQTSSQQHRTCSVHSRLKSNQLNQISENLVMKISSRNRNQPSKVLNNIPIHTISELNYIL